MTHSIRNRSRLLLGCGSVALAAGLMLAAERAEAQAFQATPTVVVGDVTFDRNAPALDFITLGSETAVIDWTPNEFTSGDALTFLPNGATAFFQNGANVSNFAVLNRILPSTNNNIVVFDGRVVSQLIDPNTGAATSGGMVAFYSPTGILVGSTARFDVGQLLLTTLEPSISSFEDFALNGGTMNLSATSGSTARIQINNGAQITATAENSFFSAIAAGVEMRGTASINGSHAYVAGEVVNLTFSNGLFDIEVPVGTARSGNVMNIAGNVGGPSSTGAGDNHMIYAVARGAADPISMFFSGNLGFEPAASAGIVNGEIILSANYDVFGRTVAGGTITDGRNAQFRDAVDPFGDAPVEAEITLNNFRSTSSLMAVSSHDVLASVGDGTSSVDGNLLLFGRERAELVAEVGNFNITGDLLVSAEAFGVEGSSLQNPDVINATAGTAAITALPGGQITIGGSAKITADAYAGANTIDLIAGRATGGSATILADEADIAITGDVFVQARGLGTTLSGILQGAESRGGLAGVTLRNGADVSFGGGLLLNVDAVGAQGSLSDSSSNSDAFAGVASILLEDVSSLNVGQTVRLNANGRGGSSNTSGAGSIGDGGVATLSLTGLGNVEIGGSLLIEAEGIGGSNAGGTGGVGLGGRASAATFDNGTILIGNNFSADALGEGGNGRTGGDGFGGISGANAITGRIDIAGRAFAGSEGVGGDASFDFGGNGGLGRGGNSAFQANGTLVDTAELRIGGDAVVFAQGVGGRGGAGDGSSIAAGRGGDGYGGQFSVPNQADPNFNSGAFLLAGGDNGTLLIEGEAVAVATGVGGRGGAGNSSQDGGRGGDAFGGLAQTGLAFLGQDGSLGLGSATFGSLLIDAIAFGGSGGQFGDALTGDGGDATGGFAVLGVRAGTLTVQNAEILASAFGGDGALGGVGNGGAVLVAGGSGGSLTIDNLFASASGFGGSSGTAVGGTGSGGQVEFDFSGIDVIVTGDASIQAHGFGGSGDNDDGGIGIGGVARVGILGSAGTGTGTITGNMVRHGQWLWR
jgi:hypothetical protein